MHVVSGYKHKIGSHCSSAAMRNLLLSNGLDISEELCFGIGAGLGFIYRKAFNPPFYFILGRSDDIEEKVMYLLGGAAIKYTNENYDKAWDETKKLLLNNEPVLINVDASKLSYMKKKFPMFDQVRYGGHRVILTGFDDDEQIVQLYDYLSPSPIIVSYDEIRKARSSEAGQTPPENMFYIFTFQERFLPLEQAVRSGIRLNVNAMLHPWYKVLGLSGLKMFCERVVLWPKFMNKDMACQNAEMTFMMMENIGTGGGNFRRLYSRFLYEAAQIVSDPAIKEAADIYADLGKKWRDVAHLLHESAQNIESGMWNGNPNNQHLLDEISLKEEKALHILEGIRFC